MARLRTKDQTYYPEGSAKTAFNNIILAHVDEKRKLIRENNTLRILFIVSWIGLLFSIVGWYQTKNMPKTAPLVIEVKEDGRAKYIGKVDKITYANFEPKEYMVQAHLADFITFTREIHLDNEVMYKNILRAFGWITNELKVRLNEEIQKEDPFSKVGREKRLIEVETILKTTDKTWQVDWYERIIAINGTQLALNKYRGLFTIQQQEPGDEKERQRNPLGIYIVDYSVTEIKKPIMEVK